jgi:hypothetical protein
MLSTTRGYKRVADLTADLRVAEKVDELNRL